MSVRSARLSLALLALLVAGCDGGTADAPNTLAARFDATREFTDLGSLVDAAGLTDRLGTEAPLTVFAPSNDAFDALGDDLVGAVLSPAQRALLARLLLHHAVAGRLAPDDLVDGDALTTLAGTTLRVRRVGDAVLVDGVAVDLQSRIEAENGVAYETRAVILTALSSRERVALSPTMGTFREQAGRAGTLDGAGPVTILAPVDDAFQRLGDLRLPLLGQPSILARALQAHVLPGDVDVEALPAGSTVTTVAGDVLAVEGEGLSRTVGGVRVLAGQKTSDGRVYVLRDVVLATLTVGEIVRLVPRAGRFEANLQSYPDVVARLNDPDDAVTVFAPSNSAYDARTALGVGPALTQPANAPLARRVATAQIVEGRYAYDDLVNGLEMTALDGTVHTVLRWPSTPPLIRGTDVQDRAYVAKNGVVYVLLEFLKPAVDAFDTAILIGLTQHAAGVRRAGIEDEIRALGDGTLFAFSNSLYTASLLARPDLGDLIRYHATAEPLPFTDVMSPDTTTFTTALGVPRRIVTFTSTTATNTRLYGAPATPPGDSQAASFRGSAYDGRGWLYEVFTVAEVPALARGQAVATDPRGRSRR